MTLVCKVGKIKRINRTPVFSTVFQYLFCLRANTLCRSRDTESAMWSIYSWLTYKYILGSSLDALDADSLMYLKQMDSLKRDQAVYLTKALRQVVLNLLGRNNAENPTRLSGASFSEEDFARFKDSSFFGPMFFVYHGILFTYFGEYVHYADLVMKLDHAHFQKAHVASPNNLWDTFLKGVCCFAAAQETGKKKYAKMGQIFRAKIKSWLDVGNPNVKHYSSLLDAEAKAFNGNKFSAINNYEVAVLLAARGGYLHDAALASERLGSFYLKLGDREEATFRIGQSIKYWREWGATAKVGHLEEKYVDLMPKPLGIVVMTPIRRP